MGQTNVTVPMVGKIVSILVKPGDAVNEDDEIAIFEAMKMEIPVVAPVAGKITEIKVEPGQLIDAETVVAVIESE
jgi:biotin carboxyl carrier protein